MELLNHYEEVYKSLSTRTIEDLLGVYENGMKNSVFCQVLAIKAINEIEVSKKWLELENYSKNLLNIFKDSNISEPHKLNFRNWLYCLYPHFSYINYIAISEVIKQIPQECAARLTDDGLKELGKSKNRDRLPKFIPLIVKSKEKVIRKFQIMEMADTLNTKEKPTAFKKFSKKISLTKEEKKTGKETSLSVQNSRLKKDILNCLEELQRKDKYIKELEDKITDQKDLIQELQKENKEFTLELKRYNKKI